mgnify:CR=1 FL=1
MDVERGPWILLAVVDEMLASDSKSAAQSSVVSASEVDVDALTLDVDDSVLVGAVMTVDVATLHLQSVRRQFSRTREPAALATGDDNPSMSLNDVPALCLLLSSAASRFASIRARSSLDKFIELSLIHI